MIRYCQGFYITYNILSNINFLYGFSFSTHYLTLTFFKIFPAIGLFMRLSLFQKLILLPKYSCMASYMATTFSGGVPTWMLWLGPGIYPPSLPIASRTLMTSFFTPAGVDFGRTCWTSIPPLNARSFPNLCFTFNGSISLALVWIGFTISTPTSIRRGKMFIALPHEWNSTLSPAEWARSIIRLQCAAKNSSNTDGLYFYSNGWNLRGLYSLFLGFIFSASTIWNESLMSFHSYSWIIGTFISSLTYYLIANKKS